MTFYEGARMLHILGGTIALASFWITAVMRKGTDRHRLLGRIYLVAITFIILTAVPLALGAFERHTPVTGAFLLYLIVITGTPAFLAWRAIRDKSDVKRYTGVAYRGLAVLSILAGATVLYLGIRFDALLLAGFSAVGLVTGSLMLRFAHRPPAERNWWLSEHYGAIIATGVATHVAFINLGLSHIVPQAWAAQLVIFSFFGPLVIAIAARQWLDRKYSRKSRRPKAVTVAALSDSAKGLVQ